MIEVRCCCVPENLIGFLPEGAGLPLRETEDAEGNIGVAYSSEERPLTEIRGMAGFVEAGGPKRTWAKPRPKTWREKPKPKPKTWRKK